MRMPIKHMPHHHKKIVFKVFNLNSKICLCIDCDRLFKRICPKHDFNQNNNFIFLE